MRRMLAYLKRHWPIALPVALLVIVGAGVGTMQYTLTPGFCASCHNMKPYYASWKASSHNKMACVQCHYAPGEQYNLAARAKGLNMVIAYWTGNYDTEYYTEIADSSCMTSGCHSAESLQGIIEWDGGGKKFNHAQHWGAKPNGMELKCNSCHSHLIGTEHMGVNTNNCFLCHFKDKVTASKPQPQEFCLNCHKVPEADIELAGQSYNHSGYVEMGVDCQRCHMDAIEGQGVARERACRECHDDPKLLTQIDNPEKMHEVHVTEHKVECFTCHNDIQHGVKIANRQINFDCQNCHSQPHLGPRELYAGTGGRGVEDMPSAMYVAQVDCIGCHLDSHTDPIEHVMQGSVMRPSVKGCVDCHGDMGAEFFTLWNETLAEALASASVKVSAAAAKVDLAGKDAQGYAEARKLIDDARHNLDFVRVGRGIHNVNYSTALLTKSEEFADQAIAALGK